MSASQLNVSITDGNFNFALKRAFTTYLGFLQYTQSNRESSLPRHGKGVETSIDISTEQDLQSQIAATQVCFKYSNRIAEDVREWMLSDIV